jgi:acyl-CoA thioesterase FadM
MVIAAYFSNIGRSSVTMNVDVLRDDRKTLVAAAHLVMVCVDLDFVKLALPPEFRELVARHIMSTEEARSAL